MTDDFDWTAWAHGHIEAIERENDALQEANAALAARVRELEEAQGELLAERERAEEYRVLLMNTAANFPRAPVTGFCRSAYGQGSRRSSGATSPSAT